MANGEMSAAAKEKKQIQDERKKLKQEEKKQKQEIKKRAKEISKREAAIEDESEKGGVPAFIITLFIVLAWLAILCLLIKLDAWNFGSEILTPLLKDVPVVNKILPGDTKDETTEEGTYGGFSSLKEAVDYLNVIQLELEHEKSVTSSYEGEIKALEDEVARLSEFANRQIEFERVYEQFYEEVIYSEKGPGAEEYKKFYEDINPTTAEALYKQVVLKLEADAEEQDWAAAYSAMKPKQAAAIFDDMTDDFARVARILGLMDADTRGKIIAAMNTDNAAKLTKLMDPTD